MEIPVVSLISCQPDIKLQFSKWMHGQLQYAFFFLSSFACQKTATFLLLSSFIKYAQFISFLMSFKISLVSQTCFNYFNFVMSADLQVLLYTCDMLSYFPYNNYCISETPFKTMPYPHHFTHFAYFTMVNYSDTFSHCNRNIILP